MFLSLCANLTCCYSLARVRKERGKEQKKETTWRRGGEGGADAGVGGGEFAKKNIVGAWQQRQGDSAGGSNQGGAPATEAGTAWVMGTAS